MSEPLTTDDLHAAMESLEGWSTDGAAITRPVTVPPDSQDELIDSVRRLAVEHGTRIEVNRADQGVLLRLGGSGVSQGDVELASAIDRMLAGVGQDRG